MRSTARMVLVAAALCGVAAASALSASGGPGLHGSRLAGAALPATPVATYPIRVSFELAYDVRWTEGPKTVADECEPWRRESGRLTVEAASDPRRAPLQGLIGVSAPQRGTLLPALTRTEPLWAQLHAVGAARGTVLRNLTHEGGPSGGCGVPQYEPPATDCGTTKRFVAQPVVLAAFRPVIRGVAGRDTLDYVHNVVPLPPADGVRQAPREPFLAFRHALLLSVQPARNLYGRGCQTTVFAPEYPVSVALDITARDWKALARLRAGRSYTLRSKPQTAGSRLDCTDQTPENVECTYTLRIQLTITRQR